MAKGKMVYVPESDRYAVMNDSEMIHPGLHCGEPVDALVHGEWIQTRIEYGSDWYLVDTDLSGMALQGQTVRVH